MGHPSWQEGLAPLSRTCCPSARGRLRLLAGDRSPSSAPPASPRHRRKCPSDPPIGHANRDSVTPGAPLLATEASWCATRRCARRVDRARAETARGAGGGDYWIEAPL